MGLVVRIRGKDAGGVQRFGDEVKEIVFGRDPRSARSCSLPT